MADMVDLPQLRSMAPKWKGKSSNTSELMTRLRHSEQTGDTVVCCPFGCTEEDHDEFNRCYHLVGYTVSQKDASQGENKKVMEPLVYSPKFRERIVSGVRVKVPAGAVFMRITTHSRVYDPNAVKPEPVMDLLDEETDDERAERELAEEAELQKV